MLTLAFIGAGQMARHHLEACGTRRQISVVGVYDHLNDRARELARIAGAQAFTSIEALLEQSRPDVVHVCTPPAAHFEAAHAALDGGAHVYVEKPLTMNHEDSKRLIA